jgi:hypothetical protein
MFVPFQITPQDPMIKRRTTVGKIFDGLEARIVD